VPIARPRFPAFLLGKIHVLYFSFQLEKIIGDNGELIQFYTKLY
jgi:hypothetical protein